MTLIFIYMFYKWPGDLSAFNEKQKAIFTLCFLGLLVFFMMIDWRISGWFL